MTTPSQSVATVALIERKDGISRSLFSRYWRDVHGVMAARIPGFDSYVQHHVWPMPEAPGPEPFEGIALVGFRSDADRAGLIESPISAFIQRDEQNVFRRALLYNLGPADVVHLRSGAAVSDAFLVVPSGVDADDVAARVAATGAGRIIAFDLTAGDPSAWNRTDVDDGGAGRRFVALLQCGWASDSARSAGVARITVEMGGAVAGYRLEDRFAMVENGRPTTIGLRGLDAARTIDEARADNQLEPAVIEAIYAIRG